MYAVVKTGGKQYCVKEGDVLSVEKVALEDGQDTVAFTEVLAINDGEMVVGTPTVEGAKVEGKVVEEGKSKKVVVYKYKSKKDYRRKQGHRQPFTKIQITKIDSGK
jgi:large subunit ribosomal protein L21